jgi:hypothetical protein
MFTTAYRSNFFYTFACRLLNHRLDLGIDWIASNEAKRVAEFSGVNGITAVMVKQRE